MKATFHALLLYHADSCRSFWQGQKAGQSDSVHETGWARSGAATCPHYRFHILRVCNVCCAIHAKSITHWLDVRFGAVSRAWPRLRFSAQRFSVVQVFKLHLFVLWVEFDVFSDYLHWLHRVHQRCNSSACSNAKSQQRNKANDKEGGCHGPDWFGKHQCVW